MACRGVLPLNEVRVDNVFTRLPINDASNCQYSTRLKLLLAYTWCIHEPRLRCRLGNIIETDDKARIIKWTLISLLYTFTRRPFYTKSAYGHWASRHGFGEPLVLTSDVFRHYTICVWATAITPINDNRAFFYTCWYLGAPNQQRRGRPGVGPLRT